MPPPRKRKDCVTSAHFRSVAKLAFSTVSNVGIPQSHIVMEFLFRFLLETPSFMITTIELVHVVNLMLIMNFTILMWKFKYCIISIITCNKRCFKMGYFQKLHFQYSLNHWFHLRVLIFDSICESNIFINEFSHQKYRNVAF